MQKGPEYVGPARAKRAVNADGSTTRIRLSANIQKPTCTTQLLSALEAWGAPLFELARRRLKVLGIEQFDVPHDFGSSHGLTRIIRLAYFESPAYVPLLFRAYERWREIEEHCGEKLLYITGSIDALTSSPTHPARSLGRRVGPRRSNHGLTGRCGSPRWGPTVKTRGC